MNLLLCEFRRALLATASLAIIVCCLYPLAVWGLGSLLFPQKAGGSLLVREGVTVGSELIGQNFSGAQYFHPRPSAAGAGYDAAGSGGSNLGPLSNKLIESVARRVIAYRQENGLGPDVPVPADAVTASGSGLDPHISPHNALLQAPRIAHARGMSLEAVHTLIGEQTEPPDLLLFGEPRVNVLLLNMSLVSNR